jgi:hypothetical protein
MKIQETYPLPSVEVVRYDAIVNVQWRNPATGEPESVAVSGYGLSFAEAYAQAEKAAREHVWDRVACHCTPGYACLPAGGFHRADCALQARSASKESESA